MKLYGTHFIADIGLPENTPSGLLRVTQDPRKTEQPPDVYVGLIKEVGNGCTMVKVGDKVSFIRWTYGQEDLDDKTILAQEKDILILGEDKAAPGIVAVNVIEKEGNIELPAWVKDENQSMTVVGQVVASGWQCTEKCDKNCVKEHVSPGDIVVFRRMPDEQYRLGSHTIIFDNVCRHCKNHLNVEVTKDVILAKLSEAGVPQLEVV